MAAWTRKASAAKALSSCVAGGAIRDDHDNNNNNQRMIPKGYLPLVLVRADDEVEEEGGAETRVLVRVKDLREPCMAALLEMAEQQFGYGQQGVLKVPCDAQRFHHVLSMARKSRVANRYMAMSR